MQISQQEVYSLDRNGVDGSLIVLMGQLPAKNTVFIKATFRCERKIKTFPGKQKPREFIITRLVLQEMLERDFQIKGILATKIKISDDIKLTGKYSCTSKFKMF